MNITSKNSGFRFMKIFRYSIILVTAALLAACGGSSSGGFDDGGSASMSITVESSEVATNSSTSVGVRFRAADGSAVADGTAVTLRSSNTNRGVVSPVGGSSGESATATTSGGQANFTFTARSSTGPVTLTASGSNPSGSGTVSTTLGIEVIEDPDADARLEISGANSMPANNENVEIFMGSPFINELTVRYNNPDGSAGSVVDGQVSVAVSPVSRGAFSTLDDPETAGVNEFFELMGSGPVNMTAGVATVFVHSFDQPGTLTVSVSAEDAGTGDTFSEDFEIEIIEGAADFLPANVDFLISNDPVYTQGSGGATSKSMSLSVTDSGGNPVPNPEGSGAEFNNVILSLDAPDGSDARLNGTGASGSVSGSEISVQTVNGVANFSISGATETGPHEITATVDRADNNVDNDLLDPLTATTTVGVGDGRLFSLEIVSPSINAIQINSASSLVETDEQATPDPETGILVPPDPDGTYSLTVTAQASDVAGNPVLPGTPIQFGKIDAPLTQGSPRLFVFSGGDGDPEEGGDLFDVLTTADGFLDHPTMVDEAVEPGDTLALFGKSVPGNREHEAVRTVASIIDDNTVTVQDSFNANDNTGAIVDDGHVIPWVIGRSRVGVIDQNGTTGEDGRVSVQMTYTIDALGRPIVVWAQGYQSGADAASVAEVEPAVYPGIAPLLLTASPNSVAGNSTAEIRLCLTDAIGAPVNFARIRGSITGANGTLDGAPMPASTADTTGSNGDGCLITQLQTSGMLPEGSSGTVLFTHGQAEAEVTVEPPGAGSLIVEPSSASDPSPNPHAVTLTLTLLDSSGQPFPNVPLEGQCESGISLVSGPGTTDADGETNATVELNLSDCGAGEGEETPTREAQCTFTTASGSPVGTFTGTGSDLTGVPVSPNPCD